MKILKLISCLLATLLLVISCYSPLVDENDRSEIIHDTDTEITKQLTSKIVSPSGYVWSRVLKKDMKGSDVKELQIRIAGYASSSASKIFVKIDGYFGSETEAAIERFQEAYGLFVDGKAGEQTYKKLNALESSDGSTAHFAFSEFYSKDGSKFSGGKVSAATVKENVRRLMWKLEALRKKMGNYPITINSGFRSISHNSSAAVGGVPNSQHLYGIAADIVVSIPGKSTADKVKIVNNAAKLCGFSEIIRYNTFNHVSSKVEYPYGSQSWYWSN